MGARKKSACDAVPWMPGGTAEWTVLHTWLVIAGVLLIFVLGLFIPPWLGLASLGSQAHQAVPYTRVWSWLAILITFIAISMVVGHGMTGRLSGLIINELNRMSLVRLQLIGWTVLVLSAIFSTALSNMAFAVATATASADQMVKAMAIGVPAELWIAMGITSASTVALPVILNQKSLGIPDRSDRKATLCHINQEKEGTCPVTSRVEAVGFVIRNHCPKNAQFCELFRGEEVGNARYLDIGKLQMFLITLVLIGGYAFMLLGVFAKGSDAISSLPGISEGLITLLLVSHTGYVTNEAVPHSVSARAGAERESAVPIAEPEPAQT
jgi:hypothetical protein